MRHVVECRLDATEIRKAIAYIRKYEELLDKQTDEALQRLAQQAMDFALPIFHAAKDSVGHLVGEAITMDVEKKGECEYAIRANGKEVIFVEFGAGDMVLGDGKYTEVVTEMGVAIYPGSWSQEHEQMYTKRGFWIHSGYEDNEKIYYIWPERPMAQMTDFIRRSVREIFEGVFG